MLLAKVYIAGHVNMPALEVDLGPFIAHAFGHLLRDKASSSGLRLIVSYDALYV